MLGIIIGLALLMYLAYKGYSIIWVAPFTAMIVALTGGLELLPAYTETYMGGLVGFAKNWFPMFMLGAVFGNLMDYTGAAQSIAAWLTSKIGPERAILGVILGCAVLTYGGISLFVVVFAMYPLGLALFREANITRKLLPGCIAMGSFTFTMTALPGTPQIQNIIPTQHFGTTPTAAPVMGIVATIFMFVLGYNYLRKREKMYKDRGEFFTEPVNIATKVEDEEALPNAFLSALPLIAVIVVLNVIVPMLADKGIVDLVDYGVIVALLVGIILSMVLNPKKAKGFPVAISKGAEGSVGAIMNTSAAVGFGTVVGVVPGFQTLTNMILGIKGNPLISTAVAVNLLAGATGSASGGMGIALEALGGKYMEIAAQTGISPEAFHRVASLASGGLDTLPHNGAVLTVLAATGMSHQESYREILVTSVILPVLSSIPAIIVASLGFV